MHLEKVVTGLHMDPVEQEEAKGEISVHQDRINHLEGR